MLSTGNVLRLIKISLTCVLKAPTDSSAALVQGMRRQRRSRHLNQTNNEPVDWQVTGHNGHKPKRPQPKRPQTGTATNRNGHKPKRPQTEWPQTGTATKPERPQTGRATNRNGHRPERPQTETATDRNGHKPKRPHQLSPTTSVVTRIYMMENIP